MLRPFILAAALAVGPLPTLAENVISLSLTPRTAREADALRLGLALYAIHREIQGGAHIDQIGQGNAAGILQDGSGSFGLIRQRGRDHSATLDQRSQPGGAYAIIQSGKGTTAHLDNPGTGILLQYGW